jgi:hypothetical protein
VDVEYVEVHVKVADEVAALEELVVDVVDVVEVVDGVELVLELVLGELEEVDDDVAKVVADVVANTVDDVELDVGVVDDDEDDPLESAT